MPERLYIQGAQAMIALEPCTSTTTAGWQDAE